MPVLSFAVALSLRSYPAWTEHASQVGEVTESDVWATRRAVCVPDVVSGELHLPSWRWRFPCDESPICNSVHLKKIGD